ncbi:putative alcohol dehydrogenase, partial [Operophtera brumata]
MAYEWKDKIVLITGAATAIGAAVHVAVLDINEKAGVSLQDELNAKYGKKVKFYKCDVSDEEQLLGIFKAVVDEQGYLDVVVNNAGIMNDSLKTYRKMIEVNV